MPLGELIAIAGAVVAFLSVCVSVWAAYHQAHKAWLIGSATLVTSLVDKFNSAEWGEKRRAEFINQLLGEKKALYPDYGFGILGFYEHVGYLVHCGAVDLMMVYNKFSWEIVCYYQLIRQGKDLKGKDLLTEFRSRHNDTIVYTEFEWLSKEMVKKYRELGMEVYDDKGRVKWMDDFINQEKELAAPAVPTP